jgi:hypothetical protein
LFTDMSLISMIGEKCNQKWLGSSPYSSEQYPAMNELHKNSPLRDLWSIGIVLLEIFIGTAIVVTYKEFGQLRRILSECERYLDPEIYELIESLLFEQGDINLGDFVNKKLAEMPRLVAENVRAMTEAIHENRMLNDFKQKGKQYMKDNSGALEKRFLIKTK